MEWIFCWKLWVGASQTDIATLFILSPHPTPLGLMKGCWKVTDPEPRSEWSEAMKLPDFSTYSCQSSAHNGTLFLKCYFPQKNSGSWTLKYCSVAAITFKIIWKLPPFHTLLKVGNGWPMHSNQKFIKSSTVLWALCTGTLSCKKRDSFPQLPWPSFFLFIF